MDIETTKESLTERIRSYGWRDVNWHSTEPGYMLVALDRNDRHQYLTSSRFAFSAQSYSGMRHSIDVAMAIVEESFRWLGDATRQGLRPWQITLSATETDDEFQRRWTLQRNDPRDDKVTDSQSLAGPHLWNLLCEANALSARDASPELITADSYAPLGFVINKDGVRVYPEPPEAIQDGECEYHLDLAVAAIPEPPAAEETSEQRAIAAQKLLWGP